MAKKVGNLQNYLLAGILTVVPLWITWLVFKFVIDQLSRLGAPWVNALARGLQFSYPSIAEVLVHPWLQPTVAVILTLLGLCLLGWITTRVVGRRIVNLFDRIMNRIPFVKKVYGSTKMLLEVLNQDKKEFDRVVLIEFPNRHMRALGFVTRIVEDRTSDQKLAAIITPAAKPSIESMSAWPTRRVMKTSAAPRAVTSHVSAPARIACAIGSSAPNHSAAPDTDRPPCPAPTRWRSRRPGHPDGTIGLGGPPPAGSDRDGPPGRARDERSTRPPHGFRMDHTAPSETRSEHGRGPGILWG